MSVSFQQLTYDISSNLNETWCDSWESATVVNQSQKAYDKHVSWIDVYSLKVLP